MLKYKMMQDLHYIIIVNLWEKLQELSSEGLCITVGSSKNRAPFGTSKTNIVRFSQMTKFA